MLLQSCFAKCTVLIHAGSYNKNTTGRELINRNLSLTVLEYGKSKVKAPEDLVSGEGSFPDSQTAMFSLYFPMMREAREFPGSSIKC
jgi:hypothetical protein